MSWLAAHGYDSHSDVDEGRTADAVFELFSAYSLAAHRGRYVDSSAPFLSPQGFPSS